MTRTEDAIAEQDQAVEALLAAVDVRLRRQTRLTTRPDAGVELDRDALSLVYVTEGRVRVEIRDTPTELAVGDLLLSSGRTAVQLTTPGGGARIVVSTLELADRSSHVGALLPEFGFVRDFDEHEPAAAALAAHLGIDLEDESAQDCTRGGDSVICRMMATTVLISAIRAWAVHGCAPAGWPSRSSDPHLDRVVAAIDAAPGDNWTIAALATIGTMSRTVFAERFRAAFGLPPAAYVTEVRMRTAQKMLAGGTAVGEVSRSLGYGSEDGFSRAFRRRTGQSPSAWRAAERPV
ncbi:helix-turn-helix transcriptional regulator [Microbacterium sp. ASV49]|uniref:AraC family transcriptional regulator n=1 Tax=Microbacterium candidum TaxID=3041922 RepID=A0ABT7N3M4_9MICO|nr:AraC family transcriptional regulator [Microbacterium sp. ASV49]MDL9981304.1 AraC family transcriptional regulator [Microbacterium sp. ASV49]